MEHMAEILTANGAAVLILIIVLISSKRTMHSTTLDSRLYFVMTVCTMLQAVLESLSFIINNNIFYGWQVIAPIVSSSLFINCISFAFIWVLYADYKIFEDTKRLKRFYLYFGIPAMLVVVGALVNLFVPVYYTLGDNNVYERIGIYNLTYVINYAYLFYGVILVYRNRKKANKYLFMPALIFIAPIVLCSILQYFFYGMSFMWLGAAISLMSVYINIQNEVSNVDSLSGLLTRQYMVRNLIAISDKEGTVGIMLDVDRFKHINDTYGHMVGDDAIATVGRILRNSSSSGDIVSRYAGDEFVIIKKQGCTDDDIDRTIRRIEENTARINASGEKEYELSLSIGYYRFCKTDTPDTFLDRLDKAMYAEKNRRKALQNQVRV